MADRGTVVWAPDPFKMDGGNPCPWLAVSGERMPYPSEESIAVAFTTQSHHAGSFAVPTRRDSVVNQGSRASCCRGRSPR